MAVGGSSADLRLGGAGEVEAAQTEAAKASKRVIEGQTGNHPA